MIIDLRKFISSERPYWTELEKTLEGLARDPVRKMSIQELERFHYLYKRASSGLSRISSFSGRQEVHSYLESLVAMSYAEINETRGAERGFFSFPFSFSPVDWFFLTLPRTFRRHIAAFLLALGIMAAGFSFGGLVIGTNRGARQEIMPFQGLRISPAQRVMREEKEKTDRLEGIKATGAARYMTHNAGISIFTFGLGITYGLGTILMLFYNGFLLGAVSIDYALAGKSEFLCAWLLPHGALEIPAILISGQAGLVLAGALIGCGRRIGLRARLRQVSNDLVTLIAGFLLLLVLAGIMESFISQYHQPVLPYPVKILIGVTVICLLIVFFARSGAGGGHEK